jgi:lipopolysaccharide/colanic/teichoic acid biosynthesis glycosyltransferase
MVMTRAVSALRRLADLVLAAFLIILLSPFVLVLLAIAHLRGGGIR